MLFSSFQYDNYINEHDYSRYKIELVFKTVTRTGKFEFTLDNSSLSECVFSAITGISERSIIGHEFSYHRTFEYDGQQRSYLSYRFDLVNSEALVNSSEVGVPNVCREGDVLVRVYNPLTIELIIIVKYSDFYHRMCYGAMHAPPFLIGEAVTKNNDWFSFLSEGITIQDLRVCVPIHHCIGKKTD